MPEHLERLPEGAERVEQTQQAVQELRIHTAAHVQLIVEKRRADAERTAYQQQAEVQRRFEDELESLRIEFLRLHADGTADARRRGQEFEPFLFNLLDLFDMDPRLSCSLEHEQVDGAFSHDTDDYVLEARWRRDKVDQKETTR